MPRPLGWTREMIVAASGWLAVTLCCTFATDAAAQQPSQLRTISLRIVVDEEFRVRPDWESVVRMRVERVSQVFETNFQIRWEILEVSPWDSLNSADADSLAEELRVNMERGEAEVLLALTGQPQARGERIGSVVPFLDVAVVIDFAQETEERNAIVLAHQLAHLFGTWHVSDPQSVMYHDPTTFQFDAASASVIRLMRDHDFRKGVDAIDEATARELARLFRESRSGEGINPLARARYNVGVMLLESGRPQEAVAQFREALRLDPDDSAAAYNLGVALKDTGDLDHAIAAFQEAVRSDPSNGRAYDNLGIALASVGRFEEAVGAFREAIRIDPDNANPRFNLATAMARQPGYLDMAIVEFQQALRIDPAHQAARRNLSIVEGVVRDLEKRIDYDRRLVRADPQSASAHYNLGVALLSRGRFDEAIEAFQAALSIAPGLGDAHANMAVALYGAGRYREAWREVRLARESGAEPNADFVRSLERKMPAPR